MIINWDIVNTQLLGILRQLKLSTYEPIEGSSIPWLDLKTFSECCSNGNIYEDHTAISSFIHH